MDSIKRYTPMMVKGDPKMVEKPDGIYVLADDLEALRARQELDRAYGKGYTDGRRGRLDFPDPSRAIAGLLYKLTQDEKEVVNLMIQLAKDEVRRELAKYKAFWDRSREIDKMNFELYDWPTKEKAGE